MVRAGSALVPPGLGRGDEGTQATPERRMTDIALSLRDVNKAFGNMQIIRGVNLEIAKGERHAIIGPNGAGKTTLFNLISGRFPITAGVIELNGARIDRL